MLKLRCKKEALNDEGEKIMNFTKGTIYNFRKIDDPDGWEVLDDNLIREIFFNPYVMFEKL